VPRAQRIDLICLHPPLALQPMAINDPVPMVDFGNSTIVRCRKCRTYINPFVQWTDGGRRFRCNLCGSLTEVPVDYFCTIDANGRRRDQMERAELSQVMDVLDCWPSHAASPFPRH